MPDAHSWPPGQPDFYHIRLFADINNQQVLVLNHVIEARYKRFADAGEKYSVSQELIFSR